MYERMSVCQKRDYYYWEPGLSVYNIFIVHLSSQVFTDGFQPSYYAIMYTIPHRETVAGEATFKSIT